jgi:hypothetical protein
MTHPSAAAGSSVPAFPVTATMQWLITEDAAEAAS